MHATTSQKHLETLRELAERRHCAALWYRTRLTPSHLFPRLVEPYGLSQGKQDVMVHCYQLEPQEGWRYFMAHKIDAVEDTGLLFTPRKQITISDDIVFGGRPIGDAWTDEMIQYRDLVSDAIADGAVGKATFDEIRRFAEEYGLADEQVRYVHAALFHRCLGSILRDGHVGDAQLAEIRLVQRILAGLGWGVTGSAGSRRAA